MQLLNCEPVPELGERMSKRKSPDFHVVDSFQYSQMSYREHIRFKEAHGDKLIIFTSHADGRNPALLSAGECINAATELLYECGKKKIKTIELLRMYPSI